MKKNKLELILSIIVILICLVFYYLCAMAKVSIKIEGIEALKKKLMEKKQAVDNVLKTALPELGEKAVTYSKENKGEFTCS